MRGRDWSEVSTPPPDEVARTTTSEVAVRAVFEMMVNLNSMLDPGVNV
jgi:hypothetical protein